MASFVGMKQGRRAPVTLELAKDTEICLGERRSFAAVLRGDKELAEAQKAETKNVSLSFKFKGGFEEWIKVGRSLEVAKSWWCSGGQIQVEVQRRGSPAGDDDG